MLFVAAGSASSAPPATARAAACSLTPALPPPPPDRVSYALRFRLDHRLTEATGSLRVSFRPAVATDRLVFRLWPNSPFYAARGARLTVAGVTAAGARVATSRPDPTTLVVDRAVAAGEEATVAMTWKLRLPRRAGLQLRGGRSARLVSFFPVLAWDGGGWATEPGLRRIDGFWSASPTADFDVRIAAPRALRVLASGEALGDGRWRALGVRDFAVAVGRFHVRQTTIRLPRPVRVLVALERGSSYPIQPFVTETVRALRLYAQRYGGYPWSTYKLVVMSDPPDLFGTAYPTVGFVGDGSAVLVPHETAHQWFLNLVGNNQARDPWLSEGLATWAQTGAERSLATLLATPIPAAVRNRIGEPMSFWDRFGFETTRLGVYVQTVQALASLGEPATVDCALRLVVVQNAYRTATPRDLLRALTTLFPDAEAKLTAYGARF
jgi:Peptidase family M1 domain